jgi:cytosine/adenosine deaminase-related metal-dependent hydrolase
MQLGLGRPVIRSCLDAGINPALGCDSVLVASGDLLIQMRMGLQYQRCMDNDLSLGKGTVPETLTLTVRDALQWATVNGARACGLDDRIGSLTPGKQADIVLIGGDSLNMIPNPDPVGSVVTQANTGNVRTVLVAGRIVKHDGVLLGVDIPTLRVRASQAQHQLFGQMAAAASDISGYAFRRAELVRTNLKGA